MVTTFKDFWTKKSHDIPIQEELDEVKDDVHELDEQVDQYEDADGNLKPGVSVGKNTVHITYDDSGVPVNSYVDKDMKVVGKPDEHQGAGKIVRWAAKQPGVVGRAAASFDSWRSQRQGGGIYDEMNDEKNKGIFPQMQVSKPGPSIHTDKWDRCVADINAKGGANAYAVCTAQLGETAFKSEYRHLSYTKSLIEKARKELVKMGIADAGGVPNSLLARQDLEGTKVDKDFATFAVVDDSGKEVATYTSRKEADDAVRAMANRNDHKYKVVEKSESDEAKADDPSLYQLKDDARDANTEDEKEEVTDKIKETQIKRQKATLKDRGVVKSFKDFWKTVSKDAVTAEDAEQNWALLKRERKELESLIASLTEKLGKIDGDMDLHKDKLEEAKDKLSEVNRQINENLNYLKAKG